MPILSDPRAHDWRQGRFASRSIIDRINASGFGLHHPIGDEDLCIIASQDCDVCCSSFDEEPMFEVVIGRRLSDDKDDGNLFYGKHPRKLQFRLTTQDGTRLYELRMLERISVPRVYLAETDDQPIGGLSSRNLELFRRWLGRRYYRAALPTEFNERCRPAQSFLSEKLKKQGARITAVFLQVDPRYDELPSEEAYRVIVHLTVLPETMESDAAVHEALAAQSLFESAFAKCGGIELLRVRIISEDEFSIQDVRQCVRWDHSDHLSYRENAAGAIAVDN